MTVCVLPPSQSAGASEVIMCESCEQGRGDWCAPVWACDCPATKECVSSPGDLAINVNQPPAPAAGWEFTPPTPRIDHVAPSSLYGGVPCLEHSGFARNTLIFMKGMNGAWGTCRCQP